MNILELNPSLNSFSNQQLEEICELIFEANKEYYSLFSNRFSNVVSNIKMQLSEKETEVFNGKVLIREYDILGVYFWYPLEEMKARQGASLKILLSTYELNEDIFKQIKAFRKGIKDITLPSLYLSRIAVSKRFRGTGAGKHLLNDFEVFAEKSGFNNTSLHVNRNNKQAILFYKQQGYHIISDEPKLEFFSMAKRI